MLSSVVEYSWPTPISQFYPLAVCNALCIYLPYLLRRLNVITSVLCKQRQPSTVFQLTAAAGEADHVESGSVPSSLTCNRPTLASTRRGFAHKIVPNGIQLWRRLCSPLGMPPDDDDDDERHVVSVEEMV